MSTPTANLSDFQLVDASKELLDVQMQILDVGCFEPFLGVTKVTKYSREISHGVG